MLGRKTKLCFSLCLFIGMVQNWHLQAHLCHSQRCVYCSTGSEKTTWSDAGRNSSQKWNTAVCLSELVVFLLEWSKAGTFRHTCVVAMAVFIAQLGQIKLLDQKLVGTHHRNGTQQSVSLRTGCSENREMWLLAIGWGLSDWDCPSFFLALPVLPKELFCIKYIDVWKWRS